MVMLFGSVARGEATADSDIDLIVVFDDLGCYRDRGDIKKGIDAVASAATGYDVRAHVTDRAEWRKRSTEVTASFEASLGGDLISLYEAMPERTSTGEEDQIARREPERSRNQIP